MSFRPSWLIDELFWLSFFYWRFYLWSLTFDILIFSLSFHKKLKNLQKILNIKENSFINILKENLPMLFLFWSINDCLLWKVLYFKFLKNILNLWLIKVSAILKCSYIQKLVIEKNWIHHEFKGLVKLAFVILTLFSFHSHSRH